MHPDPPHLPQTVPTDPGTTELLVGLQLNAGAVRAWELGGVLGRILRDGQEKGVFASRAGADGALLRCPGPQGFPAPFCIPLEAS